MKRTIKKEIRIRAVCIFLIVIISGILNMFVMRQIRNFSKSTKQATEINALALTAQKAHYGWVENLCSALNMGTEFTGSTDPKSCILGKWMYQTDHSAVEDKRILELMEKIEPIHEKIHQSATEVLELRKTDKVKAEKIYQDVTRANVTELVKLLEQVEEMTRQQVAKNEAKLDKAVAMAEISSVVSILLILVAIAWLSAYVVKAIIKPVAIITESSKSLAEGKLDFQISVNSQNEIGTLADSLNTSVGNLKLYISDISKVLSDIAGGSLDRESSIRYIGDFEEIEHSITAISKELSKTMEMIQASAVQVDAGAGQVSQGAQALAQGATEQATEVENLVHMVEEMSKQIEKGARNSAETTSEADKVAAQINICSKQMQKMAGAMDEISACSNEIQQIIKTVEDIAFQTNLLALNAAVEAARAGTAGKGFAVVADEVRNLAAKSGEAAQNTAELIEKTLRVVENGSHLTSDAQTSLLSVVEGAGIVTEKIQEISEVSTKQEETVETIKESISQISCVVNTNSATSEESAAASEELAGQAQILKNLIGKFRLRS